MPIETPRPDGSLGPLYLAGALRQIEIEPDLVDCSVGTPKDDLKDTFYRSIPLENGLVRIGMSPERIAEVFSKGYDLVCIHSNFTPQTKMVFEVAAIARKVLPQAKIITGGVNARSMAIRFTKTGLFDTICMSEGDQWIKEYILGISHRDTIVTNLDDLPLPAWDLLPFEKYDKIASPHGVDLTAGMRYAPIMTSRGCPFRCAYCHISTEKGAIGELRVKSVDRVLKEIDILMRLGVKKLFIEDDSLLAKKKRVKEIFREITHAGLTIADVNGVNLVHFFQNTPTGLEPDESYMELLYHAGFQQIVFPVESGSQRILDKYATGKLNLHTMNVLKLTSLAKKIGMATPVNMMIGFPDETEKEIMSSVDLARRLIDVGAPYVTFFIPIPFPGSILYEIAINGGHLNPEFHPDLMNWKNGVMTGTTVPQDRIVELRNWAWENVNTKEHTSTRIRESMKTRIAQ